MFSLGEPFVDIIMLRSLCLLLFQKAGIQKALTVIQPCEGVILPGLPSYLPLSSLHYTQSGASRPQLLRQAETAAADAAAAVA
jgi:hypothetical protein